MTTLEANEKIALKIKKLLALATSSNEAEAQAAMAKAQAMCIEHNLSIQYVESVGEDKDSCDPFQTFVKSEDTIVSYEDRQAASIVHKFFFVNVVWRKSRVTKRTQTLFLGRESNVQVADYVFNFLSSTFLRLWKQYRTAKKRQGINVSGGMKIEYINGLHAAVWRKLAQERAAFKQETALVVVNDALQAYANQAIGKVRAVNFGGKWADHQDARQDGLCDGKSIDIRQGVGAAKDRDALKGGK